MSSSFQDQLYIILSALLNRPGTDQPGGESLRVPTMAQNNTLPPHRDNVPGACGLCSSFCLSQSSIDRTRSDERLILPNARQQRSRERTWPRSVAKPRRVRLITCPDATGATGTVQRAAVHLVNSKRDPQRSPTARDRSEQGSEPFASIAERVFSRTDRIYEMDSPLARAEKSSVKRLS